MVDMCFALALLDSAREEKKQTDGAVQEGGPMYISRRPRIPPFPRWFNIYSEKVALKQKRLLFAWSVALKMMV